MRTLSFISVFFLLTASAFAGSFYENPAATTVAELSMYQRILSKDLPKNSGNEVGKTTWYDSDSRSSVTSFSRLGYYLEVTTSTGTEWAFVTLPDYTGGDLSKAGIPNGNVSALNYMFQTQVSGMNVYIHGVNTGKYNINLLKNATETTYTGVSGSSETYKSLLNQGGTLEIWPQSYGTGKNGKMPGVEGSNDSAYDYYDSYSGTGLGSGHGSYQFNLYDATGKTGQTLIAINHANQDLQMGIGHNNTGDGSPDWTFNNSTRNNSTVRSFEVYAMPTYSESSLIWNITRTEWNSDASHWFTASGEAATAVPGETTDVFINTGSATLPSGMSATVKTLSSGSTSALTIASGAALTVSGAFSSGEALTVNGTLTTGVATAPNLLSTTGDGVWNSTGKVTINHAEITATSFTFNATEGTEFALPLNDHSKITANLIGSTAITQSGQGAMQLSGSNSGFTGTWTVPNGSILEVTTSAALPANLSVQDGGTLSVTVGGSGFSEDAFKGLTSKLSAGAFLGILANTNTTVSTLDFSTITNIAKSGNGTLTITGNTNATRTGSFYVASGDLEIGSVSATGAVGGNFEVNDGARIVFNVKAETNSTKTLTNTLTGSGLMVVRGGTLVLGSTTPKNALNEKLGLSTIIEKGATLKLETGTHLDPVKGHAITININEGGNFELNGTQTSTTIGHSSANAMLNSTADTGTVTLTGSGRIVKTGAGISSFEQMGNESGKCLYIQMNAGSWFDIQEGTFVKGGWAYNFDFGSNKASLNVAAGAQVDLWEQTGTFDSLTGSGKVFTKTNANLVLGSANNTNCTATYTQYGVTGNTATFNGTIEKSWNGDAVTLNITKNGTGTQILNGANTYVGTTTVSNGTLQFGADGTQAATIGTGNVSVATAGKLVFNSSATNAITGTLSGTGQVVLKSAQTLKLLGAENTFTGSLMIEKGTLQLGEGSVSGSLPEKALIKFSPGTSLTCNVADGDSKTLAPVIAGSGYTFKKTGGGTLSLGSYVQPTSMELAGGTTRLTKATQVNSIALHATADSTLVLSPVTEVRPWTVTMYRWNDSKKNEYTQITPTQIENGTYTTYDVGMKTGSSSANLRVYTGALGWNAWNADTTYGSMHNAVPEVWDLFGCANCSTNASTTTASCRAYISEYSTLSYTNLIQVTEQITLTGVGYFDDRSAIFFRKANADGSYVEGSTWQELAAYTSNFEATSKTVTFEPGYYVFDLRVGDIAGNAYCSGSRYKDVNGTVLGLGVKVASSSATTYSSWTIDPTTGNFTDLPSALTVMETDANTVISNPNISIDSGKTLTISNTEAGRTGLTIESNIKGEGMLALANTNGQTLPVTLKGSIEGGLSIGPNIRATLEMPTDEQGKVSLGGDLTVAPGSTLVMNSENGVLNVSGDFTAEKAVLDFKTGGEDLALVSADSVDVSGATVNVLFTGTGTDELQNFTLFSVTDSLSQNGTNFNLSFTNTETRGNILYDPESNKMILLIGNGNSLPEPSTWILLLVGVGLLNLKLGKRK